MDLSHINTSSESIVMNAKEKLTFLRQELKKNNLDAFFVPRGDEHMGEYVAFHSERLAYLTGFKGSAGFAIVTQTKAAIFVDGRYTLQIQHEVPNKLYDYEELGIKHAATWLQKNIAPKSRIGFDPWLHTPEEIKSFEEKLGSMHVTFVPVAQNLIDLIWNDQPKVPLTPIKIHNITHAGVKSSDKRAQIAQDLIKQQADYAFLSLPDSIAWLLNVRGNDVELSPLPLSFALIDTQGHVTWFIEPAKLSTEIKVHLGNEVHFAEKHELEKHFLALSQKKILVDRLTIPFWVDAKLRQSNAELIYGQDPCLLPKAQKNEIELKGIRSAHIRDGAAVTKFLAWLSKAALTEEITEMSAQQKLLECRQEDLMFQGISFYTISGAGPNGAIVHYKSSPETNRPIAPNMIYLVDSGAQYLDGTTDITRTIAIGKPTDTQKKHFTLVLKGHIALSNARFPEGTSGHQLDAIARYPLWQEGLDYDHGTGHGVGCYLNVHEGPQRISKAPNNVALRKGMILSNEPGYYVAGEYGIRIENLVAVKESGNTNNRPMLSFETLTYAPIDRHLIDKDLLTQVEIDWVNHYHIQVRDKLNDLLDAETKTWMMDATAKI